MRIIWTDFAISNLKSIYAYYLKNANRKVADRIKSRILKSTKRLINHPKSGQIELHLKDLNKEYRYLVIDNYKIIYRVKKETIIINDVFATRQHPDKMKKEK